MPLSRGQEESPFSQQIDKLQPDGSASAWLPGPAAFQAGGRNWATGVMSQTCRDVGMSWQGKLGEVDLRKKQRVESNHRNGRRRLDLRQLWEAPTRKEEKGQEQLD